MKREASLPALVAELREAVESSASSAHIKKIADTVGRKIAVKRKRFKSKGITLNNWEDCLRKSPEQIETYLLDPEFKVLLRRDVDISFSKDVKQSNIYCCELNKTVDNVRSKGRIIFENPYVAMAGHKVITQSWARAKSISNEYKRHLPTSRYKNKSKFLRDVKIEDLEFHLFENALGILKTENKLWLYGCFDSEIGLLPTKQKTNYVRMQCDRVRRTTGTGYCTNIHSYPISLLDAQNDLSSCKNFISLLDTQKLIKTNFLR